VDDVPTKESGQAVPISYSFRDGAVTFDMVPEWHAFGGELGSGNGQTFAAHLGNPGHGSFFEIVADPLPVGAGCEAGPAPADAQALAQSIMTDPDLDVTAPVAVTVGGIDALHVDVVDAPGASTCASWGTRVITDGTDGNGWTPGWLGDEGGRMRLYLLDVPGGSAEVLAIAITASDERFEEVIEVAEPIVESIEFHAP
jgi:hypothetical protein